MESLGSALAAVFVLFLLAGTLFWLRRRGIASFSLPAMTNQKRRMEVVERVALGPQHALHLVRINGRAVLVATAPGGCQVLAGGDREFEA
jgi:flagellar biogenesis protein FliO